MDLLPLSAFLGVKHTLFWYIRGEKSVTLLYSSSHEAVCYQQQKYQVSLFTDFYGMKTKKTMVYCSQNGKTGSQQMPGRPMVTYFNCPKGDIFKGGVSFWLISRCQSVIFERVLVGTCNNGKNKYIFPKTCKREDVASQVPVWLPQFDAQNGSQGVQACAGTSCDTGPSLLTVRTLLQSTPESVGIMGTEKNGQRAQ